jgi:hypothetical protein
MSLLNGQYYVCKFYYRYPNTDENHQNYIVFRAQIVGDKERNQGQRLIGMFTTKTKFILRTNSKHIYTRDDGKEIKGYVEFQGDLYQVERISYDLNNQNELGGGRFSKMHSEKNAYKIISIL